jgi:hypothetical protein
MAQLTLYVPDELARELKKEARKAHQSVSAYVVRKLSGDRSAAKAQADYVRAIRELAGSAPDFPDVDDSDLPPNDEPEQW